MIDANEVIKPKIGKGAGLWYEVVFKVKSSTPSISTEKLRPVLAVIQNALFVQSIYVVKAKSVNSAFKLDALKSTEPS